MNTNKYSKYMKKKILPPFIMGQRNATATSSQSNCSIFSVDEDVQFVVANDDDAVLCTMPSDKNLELTRKTYSKKSTLSFPNLTPSTEPFQFSVIPDNKSISSISVPCFSTANMPKKRGPVGNLESPKKIMKVDVAKKQKCNTISIRTRESRPRHKIIPIHNEESDSDIEVVEIKVVNPNALNSQSMNGIIRRSIKRENDSRSNRRKMDDCMELSKKKIEMKPNQLQISKSCYSKMVVNEADTAPYMPNNPNTFPDVLGATKWLSTSRVQETPEKDTNRSGVAKKESSPVDKKESFLVKKKDTSLVDKRDPSPVDKKPSLIQEVSIVDVKTLKKRSELKSLYENLEEISWTQESSFKKLLQNPDYIRHSERSSGKAVGTGKSVRSTKQQSSVKSAVNTGSRKISRIKPVLKNKKLVNVKTNKKLVTLASRSKINKFNINKLSKSKYSKKLLSTRAKVSQKGDKLTKVSKDGSKVKSAEPKIKKNPTTELKIKKNTTTELKIKKSPTTELKIKKSPTTELKNKKSSSEKVEEKGAKLKNLKKQNPDSDVEKSKVKAKTETPKTNEVKIKPSILAADKMLSSPKPKVEKSEASSSGIQSVAPHSKCSSSDPCIMCDDRCFEKQNQQTDLYSKRLEMLQEYKKNDRLYSAVQMGSQCRVQIEPLEHSNLRNTEYYDDFRKQYFHQALRKAMEKREPNYIATVLQDLCDSYMNPTIEEKVSKKKKPEEEVLRSSARQIGGSLRYKEIVVKKHSNYMQVILVPNGMKKNSLSIEAIKELRDAFLLAKKDPKCRAVLLNSSGSYFCTGIDLSQLVGPNKKQACEEMAAVIRELVLVLSAFPKPIMAAVNGAAVGFGVSLLTYCDIVLASDKATFCVPSLSIGYMPEGGLTLTLPQIIGNVRCCEMLLQGSRLTASQAHQKGLVSEVLWPSRFMNEVMPRFMTVISQPLPVMEATKLLVRANIWDKLRSHMDVERRLLVNHWLAPQCQENIKRVLRLDSLID